MSAFYAELKALQSIVRRAEVLETHPRVYVNCRKAYNVEISWLHIGGGEKGS